MVFNNASGGFHVNQDLSDDIETLMLTYANANMVSNKLYKQLGQQCTRRAATYLSQCPCQDFITYDLFLSGVFPPSGQTLRNLYIDATYSPLTIYGYSNFERNKRELQAVTVTEDELVAIDWTFQTVKNYNLPGAKALFTMNKGSTKEIVNLALVSSTSVTEISHLLTKSIQKRREFKPKGLYSDTTPHNKTYWQSLFGPQLVVLLGLFHLLHCIVDTLNAKCECYWEALVNLKDCMYTYFNDHFAAFF